MRLSLITFDLPKDTQDIEDIVNDHLYTMGLKPEKIETLVIGQKLYYHIWYHPPIKVRGK
jgi:hypothetical protein